MTRMIVLCVVLASLLGVWVGLSSAGRTAVAPVMGNGSSFLGTVSADGRFVAYASRATNLDLGLKPAAGVEGIFVRDRLAGVTRQLDKSADGVPGNKDSSWPRISADGICVAFESAASNLVAGDTNGWEDVFVVSVASGTIERVSVASDGAQGVGGFGSWEPSVSADCRFVAFESWASNLVPEDTNDERDVFVRDRRNRTTEIVTISTTGVHSNGATIDPAMSADGNVVAFVTNATNLDPTDTNDGLDVYARDRRAGTTERVSVTTDGAQLDERSTPGTFGGPSLSADGRLVAFSIPGPELDPTDTNGDDDVYIRDRWNRTIVRPPLPEPAWLPTLSDDGRLIGFNSSLWPGPDHSFVFDQTTRKTEALDPPLGAIDPPIESFRATLSSTGRYVVFESRHANRNATSQVFLRDRLTGVTEPVSIPTTFAKAGAPVLRPSIPRAGKQFTVTLRVTQNEMPVIDADVICTLRAGSRRVPTIRASYRAGTARCSWKLPPDSIGKTLRGKIHASTPNGPVTRRFVADVH